MNKTPDRATYITVAVAGMITGSLMETVGEMAKELRRYAGGDFDKCLNNLESMAIRSIENAAIDGFPEGDQLFFVERTRALVAAVFKDARSS